MIGPFSMCSSVGLNLWVRDSLEIHSSRDLNFLSLICDSSKIWNHTNWLLGGISEKPAGFAFVKRIHCRSALVGRRNSFRCFWFCELFWTRFFLLWIWSRNRVRPLKILEFVFFLIEGTWDFYIWEIAIFGFLSILSNNRLICGRIVKFVHRNIP